MKRKILLVLTVVAILGLAGCQSNTNNGASVATPTNESTAIVESTVESTAASTEATKPTEETKIMEKTTAAEATKSTEKPVSVYAELENEYLKNAALENGFTLGTVMNYSQLNSKQYVPMVTGEFQSITTGNEMKAYSLLEKVF